MQLLKKIFAVDPLKSVYPLVEQINGLEEKYQNLKAEDFSKQTQEWKQQIAERVKAGEDLEDVLGELLPDAFALVREAAKQTIGQRHYDVQLLGGIVMHQGTIAEMKTGEGKTLTATLPLYLNALAGKGAHLVTVNDYLARWQGSWMGRIYHHLGLSTGVIQNGASYIFDPEAKAPETIEETEGGVILDVENLVASTRQVAYAADVTYGTNNQFGFDYLRDNMALNPAQIVQGDLHYAIVDEIDSILIDEARTPLIISAPDADASTRYREFARLVQNLEENKDYNIDEKLKAIALTEEGIHKIEKILGVDNIYVEGGISTVHHIENALRAKSLYKKDRDYVVKNNEVVIVDTFTGRLMHGRRFGEGMHQAIEAKENVPIQQESRTLATITFQNLFRLYDKLSGMNGTAVTESEEFHKIYNLDVVVIPTNEPNIREDKPDMVFQTEAAKFAAVVQDVKARHESGQPVLIGTTSIEKNELVDELLNQAGVPHEILNAKNHEREAHIIAQAGHTGAVTVATNMAGRGVDIILGGNPPNPQEAEKVRELGGLHVIGTERHESRRIDNQLRGRAGRQGDPGSTQFFISLDDDLMRLFGGDKIKSMIQSLGMPEDQPITHGMVSKSVESAQKKIEGLNFDRRKHVVEFDDVVNKHRTVIYKKRKEILRKETDLKQQTLEALQKTIDEAVDNHFAAAEVEQMPERLGEKPEEKTERKELAEIMNTIFPVTDEVKEVIKQTTNSEPLKNKLFELAKKAYEEREKQLGSDISRQIESFIWLRIIDQTWQDHLDTMENLRDSVRLRGYGQRDPLIEYKREGFQLFERLLSTIEAQIAFTIFKVTVTMQPQEAEHSPNPGINPKKIGRNDPCPCGSGKKWKQCGLKNTAEHRQKMSTSSSI